MNKKIIKGKEKRNDFILMTINWMFSSCKIGTRNYSNLRTNRLHFSWAQSWKGWGFFVHFVRRVFNRLNITTNMQTWNYIFFVVAYSRLKYVRCSLFTSEWLKKSHRSGKEISVFSWACWISMSNKNERMAKLKLKFNYIYNKPWLALDCRSIRIFTDLRTFWIFFQRLSIVFARNSHDNVRLLVCHTWN